MTDYTIVMLSPNPHYRAFDDVAYPLSFAIKRLGYSVTIKENSLSSYGTNILFGLHDFRGLNLNSLPGNIIIYNLEQVVEGSKAMHPLYLKALGRFPVWDYSQRNTALLRSRLRTINIKHVPIGYVPEMTCITPGTPKDIDVLFYGAMTKRRRKILEALAGRGIETVALRNIFGRERDDFISRSNIILNIHAYLPAILEAVRLGYLLTNSKVIVSECNSDTEIHEHFENACVFSPYENLVDTVESVLNDREVLSMQGEKGFKAFASMPYDKILERVISKKQRNSRGR